MLQRIQTKVIRTYPVVEFSPEVQRAVAAVGQHLDFLLTQTHAPFVHTGHTGSDSWSLGPANETPVIFKTFPWDQRFRKELDLPPTSQEGFGVLIRDEFLRPSDMRCLWNAFGKAYRPSPSFPMYAVSPNADKHFQLLLWKLGDGCDVFALPGVVVEEIDARLALRSFNGRIMAHHESEDAAEQTAESSKAGTEAGVDSALTAALEALCRRTQAEASTPARKSPLSGTN